MPKKFTKIIAFALLILTLTSTLSSCGKMPVLEDVRERIVYLIDASHEINEIFFGEGLPTYPRVESTADIPYQYSVENEAYYLYFEDSTVGRVCKYRQKNTTEDKYALVLSKNETIPTSYGEPVYSTDDAYYFAIDYVEPVVEYVYTEEDDQYYNVVRSDAKYLAVYEIKEAAEKVYSAEYLEGIYQAAFEGIGGGEYGIKMPRFYTEGGLLRQYNQAKNYIEVQRVYDYSTLKIVRPSNDTYMNVTVDTHLEGETEILQVTLRFVKGADGEWYLDSPTY